MRIFRYSHNGSRHVPDLRQVALGDVTFPIDGSTDEVGHVRTALDIDGLQFVDVFQRFHVVDVTEFIRERCCVVKLCQR